MPADALEDLRTPPFLLPFPKPLIVAAVSPAAAAVAAAAVVVVVVGVNFLSARFNKENLYK